MSRRSKKFSWQCNELQREYGPRYYCYDEKLLCLIHEFFLEDDVNEIVCLIKRVFKKIKKETHRSIRQFYIGKTYVDRRQDRDFNPMDLCTMTFGGVSSRFCYHRKRDYGKDGLIVLAVGKSEDYILKVKKRLIKYFWSLDDPRLANKSTLPGKKCSIKRAGYVLYVTFALE